MTWFAIMTVSYALSVVLYAIGMGAALKGRYSLHKHANTAGMWFIVTGLLIALLMMGTAWFESGQPPFKTLYQSIVFFSATTAIVFLIAARTIPVFGLATALFVVVILIVGFFNRDIDVVELPPALQSGWFVPHVVVYFFGYSALFASFVTSILYLKYPGSKKLSDHNPLGLKTLDFHRFSYAMILFGFVMLSLGLVFGAYWAKLAWGDWWSWDPKENWALITWFLYAAYLHMRLVKGIHHRALAWVSIVGFLAVMFTYLGVNYLPAAAQALHAYQ